MRARGKVSIIVPAYNEERSLAKALQSLKNQRYPNRELIVVDNASTDGTNAIARRFGDRVYLETRPGYVSAVMRGAVEAAGDFITFCDADTLYPPTWLERAIGVLVRNPAASAVYGSCTTYDAGAVMNRVNGFLYTQFLRCSRVFGLHNTSGFNLVIRRASYDAVGGYNDGFKAMSPDIELGRRLSRIGPILFRPSLEVHASFRRYQERGVLRTQWMFLKSWWRMARDRAPTISYEEYNSRLGRE